MFVLVLRALYFGFVVQSTKFKAQPKLTPMRLDLFLKASRLCPRRSVAQKLCDAGMVFLNGAAVKSAHSVKEGDQLTLRKRDKELVVKVLAVPTERQTSRHDAGNLFEVVSETHLSD